MNKPQNYRTQVVASLDAALAQPWKKLEEQDCLRVTNARGIAEPRNPFVAFEWLKLLETSKSVGPGTGWNPAHILTYNQDDQLVGATPLYLKEHSYGEYVFDWAWADAYARAGLDYYPKLLGAVPFTPVPGPRVLAANNDAAHACVIGLEKVARNNQLSSAHVLFARQDDHQIFLERGWLERTTIQFHWLNQDWKDFEDFLSSLSQPKRKKIRAERKKFAATGLHCTRLAGTDITESDWDFFYECYVRTYRAHRSSPYLTREFFMSLGSAANCLMVKVMRDQSAVAASLCVYNDHRLFGRYWGCVESIPFVHFEASYYQPIEFAIERCLKVFEGGAQGEHKMARGFSPVQTFSAHWLAHPQFKDAIERYLEREENAIHGYIDELNERNPFAKVRGVMSSANHD
jgi:uncharacterized protein